MHDSQVVDVILPGSTIGILGGGQLARMLALAAQPMGYHVVVLDPDANCPAACVVNQVITAQFDDLVALQRLVDAAQVVTLEFENIPKQSLEWLESRVPLRPGRSVLQITNDRVAEKTFINQLGIETAPWVSILEDSDFEEFTYGFPAILKSATLGYDGKGQVRVSNLREARTAWYEMNKISCVLEGVVQFDLEISVIVARSITGQECAFVPFENQHQHGILDLTIWPARIASTLLKTATDTALELARRLDVVGLLTVEMFVTRDQRVIVNELAPRPHNSGHVTIEAARTSQFAQAIRAVCGLALGNTDVLMGAAMANLLGDVWNNGIPNWPAALEVGANLHLYDKRDARPARKMGHLTALSVKADHALEIVRQARKLAFNKDQP